MIHPIQFITTNLKTRGGATNINEALEFSLNVAKKVKVKNEIPPNTQQLIVFLTDGNATYGETNGEQIKENLKKINAEMKVPIYGIAFGKDADFDLIKDISDESGGFARRIYESNVKQI